MSRRAFLTYLALSVAILIGAAAQSRLHTQEQAAMHKMPHGLKPFVLDAAPPKCASWRDTMPSVRDPRPYKLYIRAREFWRSKIGWEFTRQELQSVFHDVETAAKEGDWGARALLAHFYLRGLGVFDTNRALEPDPAKAVEIIRSAVAAGQAWGHYDLGVAYEQGYGDTPHDSAIAWAYYLRAAELGSPDAQMVLASAYIGAKKWAEADAMLRCAFKQGHGPAALKLGSYATVEKKFAAAIEFYQSGTKFGSERCAAALMLFFDPDTWMNNDKSEQDAMKRLGILPDKERSRRYAEILKVLKINPDLRLTRLDSILPLPPAKLPEWKGLHEAREPATDELPTY